MKKLIIILAICSLFSCKKEDAPGPSTASLTTPATTPPAGKDSVFKYQVVSSVLTYYEIDVKIYDGDGRLQCAAKHVGSSVGKKDVFIKITGVTNLNQQTYIKPLVKYGSTSAYGQQTADMKITVGNDSKYIERADYYVLSTASGATFN